MHSTNTLKKLVPILIILIATVVRVCLFIFSPAYELALINRNDSLSVLPQIDTMIKNVTYNTQSALPKVPADLLLGMTIGVNTIKQNTEFYQMLISTGLVHVVVVSGYNVALVIGFISSIFYQKLKSQNKLFILIFLVIYVTVCGLQPPVIRAALMGYIAYIATTEGRGLDGMLLLIFVCCLMLLISPAYIISLSFWLSTLATVGLMLYQKFIQTQLVKFFSGFGKVAEYIPLEDLSSSLACQITVWPIISHFFGRLSLISPLYNMFVLWLIPMCTILGFIFLVVTAVFPFLSSVLLYLILPFYDLFVRLVSFFALIDRGSVDIEIDLPFFILYYLSLVTLLLINNFITRRHATPINAKV